MSQNCELKRILIDISIGIIRKMICIQPRKTCLMNLI